MEFLELGPAAEVSRLDGHKVHIVRHDLCQLVRVALGPRFREPGEASAPLLRQPWPARLCSRRKGEGAARTQSVSSLILRHLSETETNCKGSNAPRIHKLDPRILQFFPCAGKNLRVHSHLPACSEAAGAKSSRGGGRSRQFSLGANDFREARQTAPPAEAKMSRSSTRKKNER